MRVNKFIKENFYIVEVLILFILSLTPLLWLEGNEIVLGHDSGFRIDPVNHLQRLVYSWDESYGFGNDWSLFKGFLVTQFPEAFFTELTKSVGLGQRLTFIFWFFTMGISMYTFMYTFFSDKKYELVRLIASVLYIFNFFLLQAWFIVERAKFSAYAAFPLGLLILIKTLNGSWSLLKGVVLFSILSFVLNGGGNPTLYGFLLLGYGITTTYFIISFLVSKNYKMIGRSIVTVVLFMTGFVIINAYWVFPQIDLAINAYSSTIASSGGIDGIIGWENSISKNASIVNIFRQQGMPDWYDNESHLYSSTYISNPLFILLSFIPLFIVLYGQMIKPLKRIEPKNRNIIAILLIIWLVSVVFTAGSHRPFGIFYITLIRYLPTFAMFRSAFYKFGSLYWFTTSVLVSYYLYAIVNKYVKQKTIQYAVYVFSIFLILFYHKPFFTGDFLIWNDPFSTKIQLPDHVSSTSSYIDQLDTSTRILLFPPLDGHVRADSYIWGFFSLDMLMRLTSNKTSVVSYFSGSPDIVKQLYTLLIESDYDSFIKLSKNMGITHILWREDVLFIDKKTTSTLFQPIMDELLLTENIKLEYQKGPWKLYKLPSSFEKTLFSSKAMMVTTDTNEVESLIAKSLPFENVITVKSEDVDEYSLDDSVFESTHVVKAYCAVCLQEQSTEITMPYALLLPDSSLYTFIESRENKLLQDAQDKPSELVDVYLQFANMRLAEINKLANRPREPITELLVQENIAKYQVLIEQAVNEAQNFSNEEKYRAFKKIQENLQLNFSYLGLISNPFQLADNEMRQLSLFLQKHFVAIEQQFMIESDDYSAVNYFVYIPKDGNYSLFAMPADTKPDTITIDGQVISNLSDDTYFTKGMHNIIFEYYQNDNIVNINLDEEISELFVPFGGAMEYEVNNIDPSVDYILSFDYRVMNGRPLIALGNLDEEKERTSYILESNQVWNKFRKRIRPIVFSKSPTLGFLQTGFEENDATMYIRDFKFAPIYTPSVHLLYKVSDIPDASIPALSYKKNSPTSYTVFIEGAKQPTILKFNQTFHKGWSAVYDTDDVVQEHFIVDEYANGWLVNREGSYIINIIYNPQKTFSNGVIISTIGWILLIIGGGILIAKRYK